MGTYNNSEFTQMQVLGKNSQRNITNNSPLAFHFLRATGMEISLINWDEICTF